MDKREREEGSTPIKTKKKICAVATPTKMKTTITSNIVKVSNLPESFMEVTFINFLERHRKKTVMKGLSSTITKCYDHCKEKRSVYVEFISSEVSSHFLNLKKRLEWYRHELHFETVDLMYEEDTVVDDKLMDSPLDEHNNNGLKLTASHTLKRTEDFQYMNTDAVFMSDETITTESRPSISSTPNKSPLKARGWSRKSLQYSERPKPIKTLQFRNVDKSYTESHFSIFLSKCLEKKCKAPGAIFQIFGYDRELDSLYVKFESADIAASALKELQHQEYNLENLVIEAVPENPSTSENLPKTLKFSNVDKTYTESHFSIFLSKCLEKKCKKPGAIFEIFGYDRELDSLYVKFESADIAESVVKGMQHQEYNLENLFIEAVKETPLTTEELSNTLKFSNVDNSYTEDHFTTFLTKCLEKKCNKPGAVFEIFGYNRELGTLFVKFESADIAESVVKGMQHQEYNLENLFIEAVKETPLTTEELPKTLKFSNVDNSYTEDHFTIFLTKCLEKKCNKPGAVFEVFGYNRELGTLLVKFESAEVAASVIEELQNQEYNLEELFIEIDKANTTKLSYESGNKTPILDDSDEEPDMNVALKDSVYCKVLSVQNMAVDDLKEYLTSAMVKAGFADISEEPIETLVFSSKDTALVKFCSCEQANIAVLLEGLTNKSAKNVKISIRKCLLDGKVSGVSEVDSVISVNSKEGQVVLMRKLIKHKHAFPQSGSHDIPLKHIAEVLKGLNVCGSVNDVRRLRRNFKEQYNRMLKDNRGGPIFKVLNVMFGNGDVSSISGTEYDPETDPPEVDTLSDTTFGNYTSNSLDNQLSKFCKVANWDLPAQIELASVCLSNKAEYDKPVSHAHFWQNVSQELCSHRFYYTAEQCKKKMDKLKQLHKDYKDANGTGRPHPLLNGYTDSQIKLFDILGELLRGNVTSEPKITCASGFRSQLHQLDRASSSQQNISHSSSQQNISREHSFRVGSRERPVVLKGRLSKQERELKASESKAEAMLIFAQAYAKNHQTGEDNIKNDEMMSS